jgi:hypothetical protein
METAQYEDLITEITTKAQGVFLWIYLVVRSLHEGLTNCDSIEVLQRRIRALPADLEQYFRHILDSVDPLYRQSMIRTFHIASGAPKPMPLMLYHFLAKEFENEGFSLQAPVRQLTGKEITFHHERTSRQLNGRCKGLLEVHANDTESTYLGYQVDFLHRTVRDFLRTKEMNEYLTPEGKDYEGSSIATLKGFSVLLKSIPLNLVDMSGGGSVSRLLADTFYFAHNAELECGQPQTELLEDLHYTLRVYASATGKPIPWYAGCYESDSERSLPRCETFLEFAIQNGLPLYVQDQINRPSRRHDIKQPLLHCALRFLPPANAFEPDLTPVVCLLLGMGHEPNQKLDDGNTVWCSFLASWAAEMSRQDSPCQSESAIKHRRHLIELLINRAADPNARSVDGKVAWALLLFAALDRDLTAAAYAEMAQTIKVLLRAGADPMWLFDKQSASRVTIWADFTSKLVSFDGWMHLEGSSRPLKQEFASKIACLLLKYGADPDALAKKSVLTWFPPRLALPLLDMAEEKKREEAAMFHDAVQEQMPHRFSAVNWAKCAVRGALG